MIFSGRFEKTSLDAFINACGISQSSYASYLLQKASKSKLVGYIVYKDAKPVCLAVTWNTRLQTSKGLVRAGVILGLYKYEKCDELTCKKLLQYSINELRTAGNEVVLFAAAFDQELKEMLKSLGFEGSAGELEIDAQFDGKKCTRAFDIAKTCEDFQKVCDIYNKSVSKRTTSYIEKTAETFERAATVNQAKVYYDDDGYFVVCKDKISEIFSVTDVNKLLSNACRLLGRDIKAYTSKDFSNQPNFEQIMLDFDNNQNVYVPVSTTEDSSQVRVMAKNLKAGITLPDSLYVGIL